MDSRRIREIRKNRGVVKRGILQTLRMIVFIAIAYWITTYLFNAEILNIADFYRSGIPATVPALVIMLGVALVITFIFQIFYFLLFLWLSPAGRRRTGSANFDEGNQQPFKSWDSD